MSKRRRKKRNNVTDYLAELVVKLFIVLTPFALVVKLFQSGVESYNRSISENPANLYIYIVALVIIIAIIYGLYYQNKRKKIEQQKRFLYLSRIDYMDGYNFELWCKSLLENSGFVNVTPTKASGDHGIDIFATKNNQRYAIQCKRFNQNVGNKAVQEAYSGCAFYRADIPVVMTNSSFTKQARQEASELGVILWDRSNIDQQLAMIQAAEKAKEQRKRKEQRKEQRKNQRG